MIFSWVPDLIKVLYNCLTSIGDDSAEQRLGEMAQACRDLSTKLKELHSDHIANAEKGLADSQWEGVGRQSFDGWWKTYINPPDTKQYNNSGNISIQEAIRRCDEAAKALDAAKKATADTKDAFVKLIWSTIIWFAAGAALSAFLAPAGAAAMWAARIRVLAEAGQLVGWLGRIQRMIAFVVRILTVFGRAPFAGRVSKALTLYGRESVGLRGVFFRALQANRTVGRWSLAGNYSATVIANMAFQGGKAVYDKATGKPVQFSDPTALTVSNLADLIMIGRFGGLTGPVGQTTGLTRLAVNNSRLLNFGMGAAAGMAPLMVIDLGFDHRPLWDSSNPFNSILVRWGISAAVAGGFNSWVGARYPGAPQWKGLAAKNAQDWHLIDRNLLAGKPTVASDGRNILLRTPDGRPFLPKWQESPLKPFDQKLVPATTEQVHFPGRGLPVDSGGKPIPYGSDGNPISQPANYIKTANVLTEARPAGPHSIYHTHRLLDPNAEVDAGTPFETVPSSGPHLHRPFPMNVAAKLPGLSHIPGVENAGFHYTAPKDPYGDPIWIPKDAANLPKWAHQLHDNSIVSPALPIKAAPFSKLPTMAQSSLLSWMPSVGLAGLRALAPVAPTPHVGEHPWNVPTDGTKAPSHPSPPPVPDPPPPPTMGGGHVTVTSFGHTDNLWDIAEKVYGDGTLWPKIYEANRAVIGADPNIVRDGTVLKIPEIPKDVDDTDS